MLKLIFTSKTVKRCRSTPYWTIVLNNCSDIYDVLSLIVKLHHKGCIITIISRSAIVINTSAYLCWQRYCSGHLLMHIIRVCPLSNVVCGASGFNVPTLHAKRVCFSKSLPDMHPSTQGDTRKNWQGTRPTAQNQNMNIVERGWQDHQICKEDNAETASMYPLQIKINVNCG